jgi:uncharacterized cupredoxin-like copper-binding protein
MVKVAIVGSAIVLCALLGPLTGRAGGAKQETVRITEREMAVSVSTARVPAGPVTFVVRNSGTIPHELVVLRWKGDPSHLPVKGYKAMEGNLALGEVEELDPGRVGRATLVLKPGKYLLICNVPGHYQLGMHAVLTAY